MEIPEDQIDAVARYFLDNPLIRINNVPSGGSNIPPTNLGNIMAMNRRSLNNSHVAAVAECSGLYYSKLRKSHCWMDRNSTNVMTTREGGLSLNGGQSWLHHALNATQYALLSSATGSPFTVTTDLTRRDISASFFIPYTVDAAKIVANDTEVVTVDEGGETRVVYKPKVNWDLSRKRFAGVIGLPEQWKAKHAHASVTIYESGKGLATGKLNHAEVEELVMLSINVMRPCITGINLVKLRECIQLQKSALIFRVPQILPPSSLPASSVSGHGAAPKAAADPVEAETADGTAATGAARKVTGLGSDPWSGPTGTTGAGDHMLSRMIGPGRVALVSLNPELPENFMPIPQESSWRQSEAVIAKFRCALPHLRQVDALAQKARAAKRLVESGVLASETGSVYRARGIGRFRSKWRVVPVARIASSDSALANTEAGAPLSAKPSRKRPRAGGDEDIDAGVGTEAETRTQKGKAGHASPGRVAPRQSGAPSRGRGRGGGSRGPSRRVGTRRGAGSGDDSDDDDSQGDESGEDDDEDDDDDDYDDSDDDEEEDVEYGDNVDGRGVSSSDGDQPAASVFLPCAQRPRSLHPRATLRDIGVAIGQAVQLPSCCPLVVDDDNVDLF